MRELLILLGSNYFMKMGPEKVIFYGRKCRYICACAMNPHEILNAKNAICGLVFFVFFLKLLDWYYYQIQY